MIFCRPDCLDRRISRITSTDLKTFSKPQVVLQPDALDPVCREFYGVGPFVYGDMFLATLSVYDSEPTEQGRYKWQGTNQMQLAYSYNGENWYRASREMFIPRTEPGTYAGGSVYGGLVGRTAENRLLFCAMVTWTEHGMDIKHTPKEWRDRAYRVYLYDMRQDGRDQNQGRGAPGRRNDHQHPHHAQRLYDSGLPGRTDRQAYSEIYPRGLQTHYGRSSVRQATVGR